jgi:PAS domain S-box-containing protein
MRAMSGWGVAVWAVAFGLLLLNAAVSTYNIDVLTRNDRAVYHSRDVSRALADLVSSLKDAETGQRGFQITGRDNYLDPFRAAEQAVPAHLDRLRGLTAGDPFHEPRVERLAALVDLRVAELERNIGARRLVGPANARALVGLGEGKALMDEIRLLAAEMDAHEEQVLAERSRVAAAKYRSSTFTALLGGVLTVLMVAMAFAVVRRELVRRQHAENEAVRAADDLAETERESADTLALLDAFLSNAPIGIAFFDPDLRYLRINHHLAAANGKPMAEHLGKPIYEAVPTMPAEVPASLQEVVRTGQPLLLREHTGRPGMPERVWLSSYFPVRSKDGRPLGVGVVAQDVTDRKRASEALQHSLDRFRTLVEALPQMVFVTDPAGTVTTTNRRWADYTGRPDASEWLAAVHPDDAAAARAAWEAALASPPDRFTHECRVGTADGGYRWMLVRAVPLRTFGGAVAQWVATLTDIDDQKRQREVLTSLVKSRTGELESANQLLRDEIGERTRAEARAEAAAVELRRSNEDLEKFAYVASHDLQEPLRKIQAFGDRLAKRFRDDLGPDGQDYLDRMKASAGRMRSLIDDLLMFSRVTTKGQPFVPVDLGAVVPEVLSDLEVRLAQTGGTVDLGELPTLNADPLQMRQLFQNLIGNALKFQKPEVPPVVTVRAVPWATLPADADPPRPAGDGYRITVADNGIGFDQNYSERIFELFQRLHGRGEYEGTGIGLAICRKIVQRHGGEIVARGRPGDGAAFVIDLPAAAG